VSYDKKTGVSLQFHLDKMFRGFVFIPLMS